MKRFLLAAAFAAITAPAPAGAEAGVSVEVGSPGFYGRIDIGGFPEPRLIFPEPVIIDHVHVVGPPIYLHVPPGHAKDWGKHCRHYDACGHRVYLRAGQLVRRGLRADLPEAQRPRKGQEAKGQVKRTAARSAVKNPLPGR